MVKGSWVIAGARMKITTNISKIQKISSREQDERFQGPGSCGQNQMPNYTTPTCIAYISNSFSNAFVHIHTPLNIDPKGSAFDSLSSKRISTFFTFWKYPQAKPIFPSGLTLFLKGLLAIGLSLVAILSPLYIDRRKLVDPELEEQSLAISSYLPLLMLFLIIAIAMSCYLDHSFTRFDPYWIYRVGGSSTGILILLLVLAFVLKFKAL
ncbi:hypothetical protein HAX54_035894 [Datura stramonium]|uniref:Uncharacterized protein n=1 Tax=Datura stramonium TaxID=4076 RepID=A0ABS8VH68_DATST|nr:hypothetical protein [Datura stramonium]